MRMHILREALFYFRKNFKMPHESEIWEPFHKLWGDCKDSPYYNKADWIKLQLLMEDYFRGKSK